MLIQTDNEMDKISQEIRTDCDKKLQTYFFTKLINDFKLEFTETTNNEIQEVVQKTDNQYEIIVKNQSTSLNKKFDCKLVGIETKTNEKLNEFEDKVECINDEVIKYQGECQNNYAKSGEINIKLNNDLNSIELNQDALTSELKILRAGLVVNKANNEMTISEILNRI